MQSEPACLEEAGQAYQRRARRTNTRAERRRSDTRMPRVLAPERTSVDLAALATVELAERCASEQAHFRRRLAVDERAGLELFRRALQERDKVAWELMYQQWKGLLLHWLLRHPAARLVLEHESSESYLTATLMKFWQATSGTKRSQPAFETLADILAYLRRCLNSVVLDAVRQIRALQPKGSEDAIAAGVVSQAESSEGDLWRCIEQALPDTREQRLVYLRYVLGYRPREVAARYPAEFPQVERVYQLERTVLQRLSRHPALARWKA